MNFVIAFEFKLLSLKLFLYYNMDGSFTMTTWREMIDKIKRRKKT